jgi:hypothetical protein
VDPTNALRLLGGAGRRNELLDCGVPLWELIAAVEGGGVRRPVRGTYALPGTHYPRVAAAALRGRVACLSACDAWGLLLLRRPVVPHILVPLNRHIKDERLAKLRLPGVHRSDDPDERRLLEPIDEAIDHVGWCTSPLEQLVIIDSALHRRRIDPVFPPVLTKGPGDRREWLLRLATGLCASVSETVAHATLTAAGFAPRIQVEREHVGRVDIEVGERHVIEVDSWKYHGTRAAFVEDRRRDREIVAAGDFPVRFPYADVVDDPLQFGLEVARITGMRISPLFQRRVAWMLARPVGHLNVRRPGAR